MTLLEEASYAVLSEIVAYFEKGKIGRGDFKDLMGHVRDTLKRFELMRVSCPTGAHLVECTCKPAIQGFAVYTLKLRRRNRE